MTMANYAEACDKEYPSTKEAIMKQASRLGGGALASAAPTLGELQSEIENAVTQTDQGICELEALYDQMMARLGGEPYYDRPRTGSATSAERTPPRPERLGHLTTLLEEHRERTNNRLQVLANLFSQISNRLD